MNRPKSGYFKFFIFFFMVPLFVFPQTSPDKFLGHRVGADRKLADYSQIKAYFTKLDSESDKLTLLTIGQSVLKKPMIMAVISSPDNIKNLEEIRAITRRLRDARDLTPADARKLAREGKVILLITCNIHATEIASSQMSMEFAYKLVTGDTPFDCKRVLNDVVVLLVPTSNPDGEQMVTEWYRKYLGTKYEGGRMPWLYHHYAGHDNNRDWFMFNLPETRAVTKVLYHDWVPQIHIDEHQMGSTGARLFIPPFMDPPVPTIHPLLWREVALCGTNMAFELQQRDRKGVVYDRSFTGWWIGACDDTSWLHNCVGLLSEMASVKIATPIYIDPSELSKSYTQKRIKFPDPWPGGWWRLRDLVDYELDFSLSLVKTSYLHKEDLLFNFYKMCKDGIEKQVKGQPFAFIIPRDQMDYPTTLRFLNILKLGGIQIHQASKDFTANEKLYKAGSFIVFMSQPYRPYAQALLEKQTYPDMRQYPGGPPVPPYDNAGWTLSLQMGVRCDQIGRPFKVESKLLETIPNPWVKTPSKTAKYLVLDTKQNASYAVVFNLIKSRTGARIFRAGECLFKKKGFHACQGSFIIENSPNVHRQLASLLKKFHLEAYSTNDISDVAHSPLKHSRFALYQSWRSSMDEGWTRYVLDDFGVPYTLLHNKDFRGKNLNLKKKVDVIVFADESGEIIKEGKPNPRSRWARYFTPLPPPYQGGIGKNGVQALKRFVADGGILVALNGASNFVIKEFSGIPASDALENVNRRDFFCPTSILKIEVDNSSPLGYGMPATASAVFSRSLAFRTSVPSGEWNRNVVARYPEKNILQSGWLLGEDWIARRPAVVDISHKKGRIILIGIRCQHRAQSHGTFKFLFNALLYPEK